MGTSPSNGLNRPVGSVRRLDARPTSLYSQGMTPRRAAASRPGPSLGVEDRLVATASELFYREGVRAVGIQRVIEEAGVAKASLYAHFESKDELVAACIDQRTAAWRPPLETRLRGPSLAPLSHSLANSS